MSDCKFCTVPELICKKSPVYLIGFQTPESDMYLQYHYIDIIQITSIDDFSKMTEFTPGSRLVLSLDEAAKLITHRKTWHTILNGTSPYGIIFENAEDLNNKNLQFRLENLHLAKDWDIVKISDTQYALSKRAAKVLIDSTQQYHDTVKKLIDSLAILRKVDLRN